MYNIYVYLDTVNGMVFLEKSSPENYFFTPTQDRYVLAVDQTIQRALLGIHWLFQKLRIRPTKIGISTSMI